MINNKCSSEICDIKFENIKLKKLYYLQLIFVKIFINLIKNKLV